MSERRRQVIAAAALVAAGLGTAAMMHVLPDRLNVPPAVGYLAALAFVVGGLLALSNVFGGPRTRAWLAAVLLACLVAPALWLAFGPGERSCTSGSFFVLFVRVQGAECRAAFAVASAVGILMLAVAVRHALRGGSGDAPSTDGALSGDARRDRVE